MTKKTPKAKDKTKKTTTKAVQTPKKETAYVGKYEHIVFHEYTENEIKEFADNLHDWFMADDTHYWIKDYLAQPNIFITRATIKAFIDKSDYFNLVYQKCKTIQETRLFKECRDAKMATGWLFGLKNIAGWRDSVEQLDDETYTDISVSFDGWK